MKTPSLLMVAASVVAAVPHIHAVEEFVTTVDGVAVTGKVITSIVFDGDNLRLTYSDFSSETVDMSLVSVIIGHEAGSGITDVVSDVPAQSGVYNVRGQRVADTPDGLLPGLYIVNGEKIYVR